MTDPSTVEAEPAPQPPARSGGGGGVKETVESILVAFILAFVFRAFVVEAFVIPTGSMATTLLGAHTRYHCPDCGYAFDMNYTNPLAGEDEDVGVPATAGKVDISLYCPNCGYQIPRDQLDDPTVYYGDRILVLKYLYLLHPPSRWDAVVFKAPPTPGQNYIKRLVGKPGEGIMVLDGDIYVRPPDAKDPTDFHVQPKPFEAQRAMWRLVYDNDYHPAGTIDRPNAKWHQPWQVTAGHCDQKSIAGGRTFAFDDAHAATTTVAYDETADPTAQGFSDYLVYDQNTRNRGGSDSLGRFQEGTLAIPARTIPDPNDIPVSDVDLRLTYRRTAGAGPFRASLTKRHHTFTAELTPTTATLYHDAGDGKRVAIGRPFPLPAGDRPLRVEIGNADYQVTLRVGDSVAAQTTPADYAPDLPKLLREFRDGPPPPPPQVTMSAADQQCQVSHVSLWRDVYYTNNPSVSPFPRWASPDNFPAKVQQLGPDEYFCCGDNSAVSWDARCWWPMKVNFPREDLFADSGRVPGRFLLGKAFYVYWPAGYRPAGFLPALIPDFQGMRLIH